MNLTVEEQLFKLRAQLTSEFAAIALPDQTNNTYRWMYVSGNTNERYKQIILKPGKGLAGAVIRIGRPLIVHADSPEAKRNVREYPIMLVEHLLSAAAVPFLLNKEQYGVLLAGSRTSGHYAKSQIEQLEQAAAQLCSVLIQHLS